MGEFETFSIYNFTIKLGPRPNIFGFIYIFAVVLLTGALLLFSELAPCKVLHFNNFMLLSYILKEFMFSG